MNNRSRMVQKAVEQAEKKNRWWEKLWEEIERTRRDNRKPHEKVIDTTFDRAPEFYDGFKTLVTDDPQAECKKGLEHLHRGKGNVWEEYMKAHVCFLKAVRAGSSEGCYRLGNMYMYGRCYSTDYNMAECMFREAAKGDYAEQAAEALKILERLRKQEE